MKITYLLIACALCGSVFAQQIQHNVMIRDVKAWQKEDKLNVEFVVDGSNAFITTQESLVLTPEIVSDNNRKSLQPVVINGNTRAKAISRAEALNEVYPLVGAPFISVRKSESAQVRYAQSVPFEGWMQNARVELKDIVYGCANCETPENRVFFSNIELEAIPEVEFTVSYITPQAEPVKNRNEVGEAYLDFQVGKSVILSDFRNNSRELNKIHDAINQLRENKDATITSIDLRGYASPEGSYQTNSSLSARRADALKFYLKDKYGYEERLFRVSSVAEDWEGLRKHIDASNLAERSSLLEIINSSSSEDAKEQQLKALPIYRTVLSEYFPLLRRVEYRLNFTVRAFSVEEGKEVIKVRPGQMSLNEMFLVANTYEKGSKEFNDIFDIAVRMFPDDVVANLNAAAAVLDKKDTATAHKYLDKYKDVPESWNNQGVLYALEGDLTNATTYFEKAKTNGSGVAAQNLEKLKLLQSYKSYNNARSR